MSTAIDLSSLSKSLNELLILLTLGDGPKHGYQLAVEIAERSGDLFRFKHGTLYPILHKLEASDLIAGAWSDEGPRGKRKAYELTAAGREHLADLRLEWSDLIAHIGQLLREDP